MARTPKSTDKPKPTGKRRWTKRILIGLVAFVVFSIGSVELTSQNWFCNSCHIMGPFYQSWKVSTHSDVHCVECHIPPGVDNFVSAKLNGLGQVVDDVLNRTSTKPSASVSAMACSRSGCHSVERLAEKSIQTASFKFDHGSHFGKEYYGIKIDCTTCHSHVAGDEHFEVNTNTCILCHLTETAPAQALHGEEPAAPAPQGTQHRIRMVVRTVAPKPVLAEDHPIAAAAPSAAEPDPHAGAIVPSADCRVCHDPPLEPFEYQGLLVNHEEFLTYGASCNSCHHSVTSTPQPITDAACLSCHTFGIDHAPGTAEEIHRVHVEGTHKVECFSCHGMPAHGPQAQAVQVAEFDCLDCHIDQHTIQRQTYLRPLPAEAPARDDLPTSPMFMAHVDCTGCHVAHSPLEGEPHNGAQVVRASAQGCNACHQPGLGEQMIPLWQTSTKGLHEQVTREIQAAETAGGLDEHRRALLDEARALAELVRLDGSWGVHNPRYTQQLLEQARDSARAAAGLAPTTPAPPADPANPPEDEDGGS